MRQTVIRAPLPALLLLCIPVIAGAQPGIPDPASSIIPQCIWLVGHDGVNADPVGRFQVTVIDNTGAPVVGSQVMVDFFPCPTIQPCNNQLDASKLVICPAKQVIDFVGTNAAGQVFFDIIGGSDGIGANPIGAGLPPCAVIRAWDPIGGGWIALGNVRAAVFDLDCFGVGANDLSVWLDDFGSGLYFERSDYDCSGSIGANDLSIWLNVFGSGASALGCPTTSGVCCGP